MESNNNFLIPFKLGNELSAESFKISQNDNTYILAGSRYKQFYSSYIRPRTAMYRGWIENYHNTEIGVIPTLFLQKIGAGIISTLFGKPLILNSENNAADAITQKEYKKSNFNPAVKEAYGFALDGGTGLLKWNRDGNNQLRAEALPMDKFFIEVDAYGDIERVKSFIATYHNTINAAQEFHLCEERFFRYATVGGKQMRYPMVHYLFYKTSTNITTETTPAPSDAIGWSEIPYDVQKMIQRDYGDIFIDGYDAMKLQTMKNGKYDRCKLLPFSDDLGCRLIKFTRNIPAFPKLPFGQPIADLLMNESYAYDQLKFFERLEVYVSRGRVMVDKRYQNPNDPDSTKNILDPLVFTYYDSLAGESDEKKPETIQPELRAEAISKQKQNILNDTAFALNLSSSTIAAWLSDGQTQKTATEIEYERTKTTAFINDKIELIQEPLQEMIDIFYHYYGATAPELNIMPENQTVRTEMIKLYSELYDKKFITAEMLAKEILGTCSVKEVNDLVYFIESQDAQKNLQMQMQALTPVNPAEGGNNENQGNIG